MLGILSSIDSIRALPGDVEEIRGSLRAAGSPQLLLRLFYAVRRMALEKAGVPKELRDEVLYAIDPATGDVNPQAAMFAGQMSERTDLLIAALRAVGDVSTQPLQDAPVTFEHPLAVFDNARLRFNVGAVARPILSGNSSNSQTSIDRSFRPSFQGRFDTSEWDRSSAINAPGQSGSPASTHYDDLAGRWAAGEDVSLAFTQSQVAAAARDVLTLNPGLGRVGDATQR